MLPSSVKCPLHLPVQDIDTRSPSRGTSTVPDCGEISGAAQNGRIRLIEDALGATRAQSRTLAGGSTAGTADGVGTAARFRQPATSRFRLTDS